MEAPSESDIALFADHCNAEITEWKANCPAEGKAKAEARPEAEQEAEFNATWGAADADGDDLLSAAEFQDFGDKMTANEEAYNGYSVHRTPEQNLEFFNKLMSIAPEGAAGISKAEFNRYFAVLMVTYAQ